MDPVRDHEAGRDGAAVIGQLFVGTTTEVSARARVAGPNPPLMRIPFRCASDAATPGLAQTASSSGASW